MASALLGVASMVIPVWYWYPALLIPLALVVAVLVLARPVDRAHRT